MWTISESHILNLTVFVAVTTAVGCLAARYDCDVIVCDVETELPFCLIIVNHQSKTALARRSLKWHRFLKEPQLKIVGFANITEGGRTSTQQKMRLEKEKFF